MKIREELGQEAVILNSKEVLRGGFFGLFAKKNIEVIAAVDATEHRLPRVMKRNFDDELLGEIQQLKGEVSKLLHGKQSDTKVFFDIERILTEQGVCERLQQHIIQRLSERFDRQELKTIPFDTQKKWALDVLNEIVNDKQIGGLRYHKPFLNLVGPTGVGKTTTLAKIAAKAMLQENKKVAFITTDTYRIAAIDQLKTYAKLLNIPVEVAYNADDFQEAKEKFRAYDLILVDSAGRNFRDRRFVLELKEVIDFDEEMETMLVLALTSKYTDIKKIIEQFQELPLQQVIFTKKDETASFGAMLNVMFEFGLGVAYITDGQNVPDDLIDVTEDYIVQSLFEDDPYA